MPAVVIVRADVSVGGAVTVLPFEEIVFPAYVARRRRITASDCSAIDRGKRGAAVPEDSDTVSNSVVT